LTSGTLVYYLAQELGARGLALSLLIAAPSLIGLLRLATPALLGPLGGVKATCLKTSLASYVLLAVGLPLVTLSGFSRPVTLAALIALICVHQLLEYVGSVALWSWLGSLVPLRVRGRYFARRNLWQLAFLIPTLLGSGRFTDQWKRSHAGEPDQILLGYIIPATIGGAFLLLSLVPLWLTPGVPTGRRRASNLRRSALAALLPLFDLRFRRLLVYRGWFSFFNGITQAAQSVFVYRVLGFGVLPMQQMQLGMRVGQMALSPVVGNVSDRFGNRPVLELSQGLVAAALLFFALATPDAKWWIVGAYVLWSAYVGVNICLNNLMLKLAPAKENTGYIALFEAIGGLTFGLSTIAGGVLLDWMQAREVSLTLGPFRLDYFAILFVAGAILRALGVFWLARIREPGAWTWREIVSRSARGRDRLT
ncbi:MAG TPA: MFS transporter, partial [Pirellulales bacterium]